VKVDAELTLDVPGGAINATLRTPRQLSQHPALLINLGGSAQAALNEQPYCIAADIFLAAGHHVVSFDLPCHGRRGSEYGGGLSGMAKAIAAGVDVFGNIQDTGRVLISRCIDEGRIGPHAVLVHGTSRGGLAAFHVAAADRRVLAVAAQVPVTHIPALEEFAHLDGNEIIEHANAAALIPRLADRPVFVAVGAVDTRVGEQHCFDFCAALDAASNATTSLFTAPGRSHGGGDPDELRFPTELGYQAGAAFLLQHFAQSAKAN
jgi:pimeloyl-ACP methyl ester carboxylesterase